LLKLDSLLYNHPAMLEQHLPCPKCGYDLHGIPAVRCPECGFRYDADALRSVHESAETKRLTTARGIIVRGVAATALALPAVCERAGVTGWPQLLIVAFVYLVAFATWIVMSDEYRGLVSVPNLILLIVAVGLALGLAIRVSRFVVLMAGCVVLAQAWQMRLRDWPSLPTVHDETATEFRRVVDRYSLAATTVLVVTSLFVGLFLSFYAL
jgi:hypothetical protein